MFKKLLKALFKKEKWETVFFTYNQDEFFRIKTKLYDNGIPYKIKNSNDVYQTGGYEIQVSPDKAYEANHIIHHT